MFVTCWVAVLTVLQKYLAGLSKNGLGVAAEASKGHYYPARAWALV